MNKCGYCKMAHGMIGDVVCSFIKSAFYSYPKHKFFALEWHYEPDKIPNYEGRERFVAFTDLLEKLKPNPIFDSRAKNKGGRPKGSKNKPKAPIEILPEKASR